MSVRVGREAKVMLSEPVSATAVLIAEMSNWSLDGYNVDLIN